MVGRRAAESCPVRPFGARGRNRAARPAALWRRRGREAYGIPRAEAAAARPRPPPHSGPVPATIPADLSAALADRYVLERELGRGGMATVYLARDRKHDRSVAIKVLRPELASSMGAGRFVREIAIAARLQHPHILTL